MRRGSRGFTLLEVMVALAVVAIALSAIINTAGGNARNAIYLRDRTFAHWVAVDILTEYQVLGEWPADGSGNGSEEMAEQEWLWDMRVEQTPDAYVKQVTVSVRHAESDQSLASVSGYLGRPGGPE